MPQNLTHIHIPLPTFVAFPTLELVFRVYIYDSVTPKDI